MSSELTESNIINTISQKILNVWFVPCMDYFRRKRRIAKISASENCFRIFM